MLMRERNLSDWNPENEKFWESTGKYIARRNLIWSVVAEYLGFSVWLLWSIVAVKLPQAGFHYTTDQLFQLVALPGLIGALARFPYAFAPAIFGGRNWTIVSAGVLFFPTLGLAYFVTQPETPFWLMLIVAATVPRAHVVVLPTQDVVPCQSARVREHEHQPLATTLIARLNTSSKVAAYSTGGRAV
jgi:hypothetical protein